MTQQEILDKVAKFEKGLSNPNIPESAKATMKKNIEDLKSQLAKAEEKVEQTEKKLEKEEVKAQEDLEAIVAKYEKGLSNPNIPASAKEQIKKKLAAAKEELSKQKKEIKEDKKEAATEKKEIRKAVKKVEEAVKKVRKTPIKKGAKAPAKDKAPAKVKLPKVEEKKRVEKSKKRKAKLKDLMTDLEKLIQQNKKLGYYKGAKVDLEKDAKRSAKPRGYRFVGKHDYRDPKKVLSEKQFANAKKRGTIDYEARPNRSDAFPKGYKGSIRKKLADGGMM